MTPTKQTTEQAVVPVVSEVVDWKLEREMFIDWHDNRHSSIKNAWTAWQSRAAIAQSTPHVPAGEPIGYLPAHELDRLRSGHDANLRSAKFGPSSLDGDVPVYLATPRAPKPAAPEAQTCEGCNGNGEVGGLRPDGYHSEECPFCKGTGFAAPTAAQGHVSVPMTITPQIQKAIWVFCGGNVDHAVIEHVYKGVVAAVSDRSYEFADVFLAKGQA